MNVALTTRHGHMVPCFSGVELLVIPPDQDLDRCEPVSTADWPPLAWGRELARRDVGVLICSGIYPFLWGALRGHGIDVVPNAIGESSSVLADWRSGALTVPPVWPCYPELHVGGRGRRGRRFRGGRQ